jgi:hypothetical protein
MTVWLTFDSEAQRSIRSAFNLLTLSTLIRPAQAQEVWDEMVDEISTVISDGTADMWYLFDRLMLLAVADDALLVDLSNPESLGPADITAEAEATVPGEFEEIEGTVAIRVTQNSHGRWFVHQVIVPGGDEDQIPSSVPPT